MSKYRAFFGPNFPAFRLNTEYIFSPNTEMFKPEITPDLDSSHVVLCNEQLHIPEHNCTF